MKIRKDYTCPLEVVHDMVKGNEKQLLFFLGRDKKCSFSYLHKTINNISEKMLIEQLRKLKAF